MIYVNRMNPATTTKPITALYPGTCTICGRRWRAGDQIVWTKGQGAKGSGQHAACASGAPAPKAAPAKARKASAPRGPKTPPPAGPELRNDDSPYTVGEVLVALLPGSVVAECEARQGITATEIPGPAPKRASDRRVAVVALWAERISGELAEDMGYIGRYGAIVRLATAEEAGAVVAQRQAKQVQAAWSTFCSGWERLAERVRNAALSSLVFVEGGKFERAGAEILHEERKGLHGAPSARWSRLADGSILIERWSYDDDRWGCWVTVEQLLKLARASNRTLEEAVRGQRYSAIDRAIVWLAAQDGRSPRPPVTVTLHGLDAPVELEVTARRRGDRTILHAERVGGGQVRTPDGRVHYELEWDVDQLDRQLAPAAAADAFDGIEFAPGAELGGDRLMLPGGLWITGIRAAVRDLASA